MLSFKLRALRPEERVIGSSRFSRKFSTECVGSSLFRASVYIGGFLGCAKLLH